MYDHHLNTQELIDGGVVSVIVGLYKKWSFFKYVLNDNCKRILDQVASSTLILQAYYYYWVNRNPVSEADWFCNAMQEYPVKFAWADLEDVSASSQRSEQNRKFVDELHKNMPSSGVYSGKWYIDENPDMNKWIGKYPFWLSEYAHQPFVKTLMTWDQLKANWLPNYSLLLPPGVTSVAGHQFTGDRCLLPGVYSEYGYRDVLDVSVFTPEFIQSLCGTPVPVPPPAPALDYIVNTNCNVRLGPSTSFGIVRVAMKGEVIHLKSIVLTNTYAEMSDGNWITFSFLTKA
jgi:hypothetical protein